MEWDKSAEFTKLDLHFQLELVKSLWKALLSIHIYAHTDVSNSLCIVIIMVSNLLEKITSE